MVAKRDEADKLIDELIDGKTPEEIVGEGGLLQAKPQVKTVTSNNP